MIYKLVTFYRSNIHFQHIWRWLWVHWAQGLHAVFKINALDFLWLPWYCLKIWHDRLQEMPGTVCIRTVNYVITKKQNKKHFAIKLHPLSILRETETFWCGMGKNDWGQNVHFWTQLDLALTKSYQVRIWECWKVKLEAFYKLIVFPLPVSSFPRKVVAFQCTDTDFPSPLSRRVSANCPLGLQTVEKVLFLSCPSH